MAYTAIKVTVGNPVKASDQAQLYTNFTEVKNNLTKKSALVILNNSITVLDAVVTQIPWDTYDYDDASFWSSGSPTRLTVPSNINYVTLSFGFQLTAATTAGTGMYFYVSKNGSTYAYGYFMKGTSFSNSASSPVVAVTAGDYFQATVLGGTGSPTDLTRNTWFSIEGFK